MALECGHSMLCWPLLLSVILSHASEASYLLVWALCVRLVSPDDAKLNEGHSRAARVDIIHLLRFNHIMETAPLSREVTVFRPPSGFCVLLEPLLCLT